MCVWRVAGGGSGIEPTRPSPLPGRGPISMPNSMPISMDAAC